MPVTSYSPVEQGRLPRGGALARVAERHGVTTFQVALAWVVRDGTVLAIPKAGDAVHVRENCSAAELQLTDDDLAELDVEFPPPRRATPLAML